MSVFGPAPYFYYYRSVIYLEILVIPPALFLLRIILTIWGFFVAHMNFRSVFLFVWKMKWEFWLELHWLCKLLVFYWDSLVIFFFKFINVVYYIYWFVFVESPPQFRDKTIFDMVDNLDVCLYSACKYLMKYFWICVHQGYWSVFSSLRPSSDVGIIVRLAL